MKPFETVSILSAVAKISQKRGGIPHFRLIFAHFSVFSRHFVVPHDGKNGLLCAIAEQAVFFASFYFTVQVPSAFSITAKAEVSM